MSRRRHKSSHVNHERWLVSYADFITLLFAFFVVLYASSQVDKRKVGQLATAIQTAFQQLGAFPNLGNPVPTAPNAPLDPEILQAIQQVQREALRENLAPLPVANETVDLSDLRHELEQSLAPEIARDEIALRLEPDGLVISLREIGFFASGSAEVREEALSAFGRIAKILADQRYRIRIEGHTDDRPIHNTRFADNWELSTARAAELVRLLITRYGFAPANLSAAGYAEFHPVSPNDSPEARAHNRRVDVVILGKATTRANASPGSAVAPASPDHSSTDAAPSPVSSKPSPAIYPPSE